MKTLRAVQKDTGNTPQALRDRPALKISNRHHLKAFYEISAGRASGEVPQAITPQAVKAYCELMHVQPQAERERLYRIVRRLDAVYLKAAADRRKTEIDQLKLKNKPKSPRR